MVRLPAFLAVLLASAAVLAAPGEVGFVEEFALAPDRTVPLKELIAGTPEYYYYHCLHYQNTGALDQAEDMLRRWIKKHGRGDSVEEMLNRQALLRYPKDPKLALARIRQQLKLTFNHTRREREGETTYPIRIEPLLLDRDVLDKQAFAADKLLGGFTEAACRRLAGMDLSRERRRVLLNSLNLPDLPNLVGLVVADLQQEDSQGFGSLRIHKRMTLAQLDACAERIPALLGNASFVGACLARLVPNPGEDAAAPAVRLSYLERLQTFADRLPPLWNTLKANVLYRRLEFDRTQDVHDRQRFLAYLQLPRNASYVRREYLQKADFRDVVVDLAAKVPELPAELGQRIGDDERLVRAYLHHFLVDVQGYADFAPFLEEAYVKEVFAEANILAGTGDQERWHTMLTPPQLRALTERVDIELLPTCRKRFRVEELVKLNVAIQNVDSLLVQVYEINTFNYYRAKGEAVGTSVDLAGLVPSRERTFTYKQPALRRHTETFAFPELNRPGVWVIELIGNGRSSRAVIRKGELRFTERTGAAGQVFRIYDQDSALVKDATLWLRNQEYRPDDDGEIVVPFAPRRRGHGEVRRDRVVLRRNGFASLSEFHREGESYGIWLNYWSSREGLIRGEPARLLLQPSLTLNASPIDIGLLKEVRVTVSVWSGKNRRTIRTWHNPELSSDGVMVCEFLAPEDARDVALMVSGKVRNLSTGEEEAVWNEKLVRINDIKSLGVTSAFHLRPTDEGYVLELLGRTGEALPRRSVSLRLTHVEYAATMELTLQTDGKGRVWLGQLPGIVFLSAKGADAEFATDLEESRGVVFDAPAYEEIAVGETIQMPFPGGSLGQVSLLSVSGLPDFARGKAGVLACGAVVEDCRKHAEIRDGQLTIGGLPVGEYVLELRGLFGDSKACLPLTVHPGFRRDGDIVSPNEVPCPTVPRHLGIRKLSVVRAEGGHRLTARLINPSADTKVHILAGRYVVSPWFRNPLGAAFVGSCTPGMSTECLYTSRDVGDELRYVLERRLGRRWAGNMLSKPSMLLNPWSLGETATDEERLRKGTAYPEVGADGGGEGGGRTPRFGPNGRSPAGRPRGLVNPACYDFLPSPALVVANLKPDAKGIVTVDLDLGGRQYIRVLAIDSQDAVLQSVLLPFVEETYRDLRPPLALPTERHLAQQRRVDIVAAGKPFTVPEMRSSKVRVCTDLAGAHWLLSALSQNRTLAEFDFICRWPGLSNEEKGALYGKHACHELSFFVYQKDRAFFDRVVRPHLASKKDKTFMDHWLLGDDLSAFLEPWAYGRLNIVERILLGQHLPAQRGSIGRDVQDLYGLAVPDVKAQELRSNLALEAVGLYGSTGVMLGNYAGIGNGMGQPVRPPEDLQAHTRQAPESIDWGGDDDDDDDRAPRNGGGRNKVLARDKERRDEVRQLFREVGTTREWLESNYYQLSAQETTAGLIVVNGFWRDYAAHDGKTPFLSTHLPEVSTSFAEAMLALAVLDLPFEGEAPDPVIDGPGMTLTPKHPIIVFHQQIREAKPAANAPPLLLGQHFFAADDRYRWDGERKLGKFVTREFQSGRVYGCHVVVTNPSATPQTINLLLHTPPGAIPVENGFRTRGMHVALGGYATETGNYYFYFPKPGDFALYPAQASRNGDLLAFAKPFTFHVVERLTMIDTTSWEHVSQYGSPDQVLALLEASNLRRLDLGLIAFRMKDKASFRRVIPLLRSRRVFHPVLWSYGVLHNDPAAIREYVPHTSLADRCGMVFQSPLLAIDPVARARYEHKEYWPLINARSHRVGGRPRILNQQLHAQYTQFLTTLAYRPALGDEEHLALTTYLLLQDRVDESLTAFAKVDPTKLAERVQYDYLKAYLAFSQSDPKTARRIARGYRKWPVPRWQKLFAEILAQCDEIAGDATVAVDKENRAQTQTALAATQPNFEFAIKDGEIRLDYQNLASVELNFYRMDLELLFSRTPFLMDVSEQFLVIQPNATQGVKLAKRKTSRNIPIPKAFAKMNTMVEVVGAGQRQARPHYPNQMTVQMTEAYGQIKVTQAGTRKPLAAAYVKVYARRQGGRVVFFKDGYTDLRGRFDYASVSSSDAGPVERFAILVLSDTAGAVVREARPPAR